MLITCRGAELERIVEYDVLGNMLNDLNLSPQKRSTRGPEGLGYANFSDIRFGKIENGLVIDAALIMLASDLRAVGANIAPATSYYSANEVDPYY